MCACERVKGLTSHSWSIGSFAFVGYGTRYNRCTQGRFMDGGEQGGKGRRSSMVRSVLGSVFGISHCCCCSFCCVDNVK